MFHASLTTTLAALLTIMAVTSTASAKKPWFCQRYDCPGFTAQDGGGYEIRDYEESSWVATSVTSSQPDPSRSQTSAMFRLLFNYISGANANSQKIKMTVPVLTKIENQGSQYKLTMMFYLAVANPPAPNSDSVFLVSRPAGPVFVRSFPRWWWVSSGMYRSELQKMKNAIGDSSVYSDDVYFKASYNSPYDFLKKKQHEVWLDRV